VQSRTGRKRRRSGEGWTCGGVLSKITDSGGGPAQGTVGAGEAAEPLRRRGKPFQAAQPLFELVHELLPPLGVVA
jgi:hypothetical protein